MSVLRPYSVKEAGESVGCSSFLTFIEWFEPSKQTMNFDFGSFDIINMICEFYLVFS